MEIVGKLRGIWTRIGSADADLAPEAAFARMATAALAGLFGPPMLALPSDQLNWQIWGCLALVLPLIALTQVAARRSGMAFALLGFAGAGAGAVAAGSPHYQAIACWTMLVPLETALVLAATRTYFGGLFPLVLSLGLAIAERIGLAGANRELMIAAIFAAPAAIPGALLARRAHVAARARRHRQWLINQQQSVLSASGELFVWLDATGKALEVSREFAELLRLDADDLLGQGLFNRVHVADRPRFLQALNRARHANETTVASTRVRSGVGARSSGNQEAARFVWLEARMRRLASPSRPDQAAVVVALRDVTDAKEIEQRLENERDEATAATSLKDRLLANVSHELRTPLNAILGFSEILGDARLSPAAPERRLEYAQIIHASAQHLLSVVNLLLDMSKLEVGRYEIDPEAFEVHPLIRNCVHMLRLKAEEREIAILHVSAKENCELVADKRACRQVLLNLLSNAVKFTPNGGQVSIDYEIVGDAVEISVADTGIGIAQEHLPRIGDPFFQARSGFDAPGDGAGLGLALVRGLVGLHGGALTIESAPGVGTRVTVRLPLRGPKPTDGGSAAVHFKTFTRPSPGAKLGKGHAAAEQKIA